MAALLGYVLAIAAPICGLMGVAPAAAGSHSTVPPRRVGGNMDVRLSGVVAELRSSQVVDAPNWTVTAFFPVAVLGAV